MCKDCVYYRGDKDGFCYLTGAITYANYNKCKGYYDDENSQRSESEDFIEIIAEKK